ncbi:MAG: hypothetical protein AAF371_00540 [Pseudomonadota bacterium]
MTMLSSSGATAHGAGAKGLTDRLGQFMSRKPEEGDGPKVSGGATAGGASEAAKPEGLWRRIVASPILFRSAITILALLAAAQWALIFFNYWR